MPQVPSVDLNDQRSIPQLGFGVWQVSTDDIVDAVSHALRTGYRHIDTAQAYGNEEGVGEAIAKSGIPREQLWITTKLNNGKHTRAEAVSEAKTSLSKLGLDAVDLYLIHWPTPGTGDYVDTWRGMLDAREQGLATSVGVSNFQPDHLRRLSDEVGQLPVVNQVELHPTFANAAVVAADNEYGIKTEAWSPLGLGADLKNETIIALAQKVGRTPAQVILRWHLQQGRIIFPKSVTPSRIEENFNIFDFELSDDDLTEIDRLDVGNRTGPHPDTMG